MASLKYLLMVGFLGAALAVSGLLTAQAGFGVEAERSAELGAVPVTERLTSAINLMLSQDEESCVDMELPEITCTIRFYGKYVETTVTRRDAQASHGLYVYEDVRESPHQAPDAITCPGPSNVTGDDEGSRGEEIRVSRAENAEGIVIKTVPSSDEGGCGIV